MMVYTQQFQRRELLTKLIISTPKLRSLGYQEDSSDVDDRRPRAAFHLRKNLPPINYDVRESFKDLSLYLDKRAEEVMQSPPKPEGTGTPKRRTTRFGGVARTGMYSDELNFPQLSAGDSGDALTKTPRRSTHLSKQKNGSTSYIEANEWKSGVRFSMREQNNTSEEPLLSRDVTDLWDDQAWMPSNRNAGKHLAALDQRNGGSGETAQFILRPQPPRSSRKRIVKDDDDDDDEGDSIRVAKRPKFLPTPSVTDTVDLTTPPPELPEMPTAPVKIKRERKESATDRSFTMSIEPVNGKDAELLEQLRNLLRQYQASVILKRPDLENTVLAVLRSSNIPHAVFNEFASICYSGLEGGPLRPDSSLGEWLKERWVQYMTNSNASGG
ncbi:hypothetical protein CB0940_07942 [Cercospora beticola]|uniref:Uncharacterized protein n=1 Tax=Cercospora beticola TaxID=122368 RepID=A0A2G5H8B1_CERBT|nr:hypothetical protein CB0940_07942 [Cercospora beticola]PIA88761.1 hypothetical protein CB0940_07942 [Cercospora beticola]WPB03913.1 hypothetical protein RHO25_008557 [Cercospora beticola]CAK1357302.1 unnamed protein product [Cercospora beticola]